ncbi:hypothetical protein HPB47_011577 [Ixodes persulcatus]|uniref:Uncharacterized protein n=1 Tax=Ixodes persulcatus TaxID=34615 RepID=A0AC60NVU6_IXOPE|nr:hypothetical protein HPB47_011577 [Ixodes persulcatus]
MSSSEKEANIGDHSSSDITPGQRPPVNPIEDSPAATPNASYEYSNIEHSDMEQDNDSGGQWCISGNRKRFRSDDSLSDSGTARVSNTVSNSLTVVYAPTDSEKRLTSLSSLKSPMKNWHNTYDQKPRLPTRDDLENLESSKLSSAAATSRAMSY